MVENWIEETFYLTNETTSDLPWTSVQVTARARVNVCKLNVTGYLPFVMIIELAKCFALITIKTFKQLCN